MEGLINNKDRHIPNAIPPPKPVIPNEPLMTPAMIKCSVCQCLADTTIQLAATKCGHIFCEECLTAALKHANKCPICRKPVPKKSGWYKIFI
jgi:hypothetical protein